MRNAFPGGNTGVGFEEQGAVEEDSSPPSVPVEAPSTVSPRWLTPCHCHQPLHCPSVPLPSSPYTTLLFEKKTAKDRKTKPKRLSFDPVFSFCYCLLSPTSFSLTVFILGLRSLSPSWPVAIDSFRPLQITAPLSHLPRSLVDALFIEKSPRTFPPGFLSPPFSNSPISLFILKFPTHRDV